MSEQESQMTSSSLSLESLNFIQGDKFNIESGQYYVLEFWATWCPPCVKSIPHLNELYNNYKDVVNFVGITDDSVEKIIKFINARKDTMTYPVALDVDHVLHDDLNISGIPALFIINGEGKTIWTGHPADPQVEIELLKIKDLK